jgi:hypothetical protein
VPLMNQGSIMPLSEPISSIAAIALLVTVPGVLFAILFLTKQRVTSRNKGLLSIMLFIGMVFLGLSALIKDIDIEQLAYDLGVSLLGTVFIIVIWELLKSQDGNE